MFSTTVQWDGLEVFAATKARDRESLGQRVTDWLRRNRHFTVVDRAVLQSSDNEYHCLSVVLFYRRA